jgi:superoxide dismutase, Cu-Zn family
MNRFAPALAVLVLTAGCSHSPEVNTSTTQAMDVLEAQIQPTQGNTVKGVVRFTAQPDGSVRVEAELEDLAPNTAHAIHVHETGDCSAPDAMSAGAHYNPEAKPHALPSTPDRHAGDLGNLTADAAGSTHYTITVNNISLATGKNPVLGKAVIIHAQQDDGSQPSGNAGARLGCGVIQVK